MRNYVDAGNDIRTDLDTLTDLKHGRGLPNRKGFSCRNQYCKNKSQRWKDCYHAIQFKDIHVVTKVL